MSVVGLPKEQLDTPILWVELDAMENNILTLAAHFASAGVQWRPHMKGIKIPAIAHKALAAGAIGVTCAKLGEAEVMAAAGISDILVANQIVGPHKIQRLVNLANYTDIKVAVDNAENVRELGQAARARGVTIGIVIDVDTGMHRTGVLPGQDVLALARLVNKTDGLCFLGVMAWEGHTLLHSDPEVKKREITKSIDQLAACATLCREAGLNVSIVSGGGSGTYKVTPFLQSMTEIQAGGAIFSDVAYTRWGVETTPCLSVRSIVTSRPTPDRIVLDAGFKTLSTWHAQPRPVGIDNIKSFSTSAEHGIITLESPNHDIKVGDTFDIIVGYTDSTLFLHDRLYGLRHGIVEVVWDVAGRGKLA